MKEAKRTEERAQHPGFSPDFIESIAENEARRAMRKQATVLTLEEFVHQKQQNPDFFLKPVAVLVDAPLVSVAPPDQEIVMTDDAVVPPDEQPTAGSGEEETQPASESASDPVMEPAMPVATIAQDAELANAAPVETEEANPVRPVGVSNDGGEPGIE
jgi:hypothetical protein